MQRILPILCALLLAAHLATPLAAQTPAPTQPTPGALAPAELDELRASFTPDAATRAIMNAVATQSTRTLAQDRATVTSIDHLFSHRIKTEGVTDQKSSGRCWLFAGLNILRPVAMTSLNTQGFEFSQNFLTFYDKLEKANLFLESIIATRTRRRRSRRRMAPEESHARRGTVEPRPRTHREVRRRAFRHHA
jgi:hypothetical protein